MPVNIDLTDKVAIITGSAQGIGKCIAESLAEAGASVVITDINESGVNEVVDEFTGSGKKAIGIAADVSNAESADNLVKETLAQLGKVDILVNNAGITRDSLLMRMSEEDFDSVIKVNLKGAYLMCKAVCRPMMKNRAGSIINISSLIGLRGNPGQTNYAASKAGLLGITKTLAKELASRNIRVNAVAPGYIVTAMTDKLDDKTKEQLMEMIPIKKLGFPHDVANAVLFLASDLGGYITGETISVDGGMNI